MRRIMKRGLGILLSVIMLVGLVQPLAERAGSAGSVVMAAATPEENVAFTETVELQKNGTWYLDQTNLKPGTKYKMVIEYTAEQTITVQCYHKTYETNADGSYINYDSLTKYQWGKTMTEDTSTPGTYSLVFETAPIDCDFIRFQFNGKQTTAFTSITLYEESHIEIGGSIGQKTAKNQLTVGESTTLSATLVGLSGTVAWASSDTSVASITSEGVLTANKVGKTEITATLISEGVTYQDYFELYVVNASLETSGYGLVSDADALADFTLQIPTGEDLRVLQISDTQIIDATGMRTSTRLSATEQARWTDNLYENCNYYIEETFKRLAINNQLPHLVVLIGDNTYGEFDDDGESLNALVAKMDEMCEKYNTYWTFVFGNHDKESDIGMEETLRRYSKASRCLYAYKNISGDSNMSIAIKQNDAYAQMIYLFDTHGTATNRVDQYANVPKGIYSSQVAWFTSVADNHKDVPAQIYMHIAMEEYARTFAARGYGDYDTVIASGAEAYVTENERGDFGELHEQISIWDDDTTNEGTIFYQTILDNGYNVKGIFCGHSHQINFSVVTDESIRLTFGLKTGTYDAYYKNMLGGTLSTYTTTAETPDLNVEHVYAVDTNLEDFNTAVQTSDTGLGIRAQNMEIMDKGGGMDMELVTESDGDKSIKLTYTGEGSGNQFIIFKTPDLEEGKSYCLSYSIKNSNSEARHQVDLGVNGTGLIDDVGYRNGFTEKTMYRDFEDVSMSASIHSSTKYPYIRIWFYSCEVGDTFTIDYLMFSEVQEEKLDEAVFTNVTEEDTGKPKDVIMNGNMDVEWGGAVDAEIIDEDDDADGTADGKAVELTFNDREGVTKRITFWTPSIKKGAVYRVTYKITQTNKNIANRPNLYEDDEKRYSTGNVTHQFTGDKMMESVLLSPSSQDYDKPYVAIYLWNNTVGAQDTVIVDDFTIVEIKAQKRDYNADTVVNVGDLVRLEKYMQDNNTLFAATAELHEDEEIHDSELTDMWATLLANETEMTIGSDDGTFEHIPGDITLSQSRELKKELNVSAYGSNGTNWSPKVEFQRVYGKQDILGNKNNTVSVTSHGTADYDLLYIGFDFETPIIAGTTCEVSMKLSELHKDQLLGSWGYWVTTDVTASGGPDTNVIKSYAGLAASKLFDDNGVTFTFTAKEDTNKFYLVLREQSTDVHFDFIIDDITFIASE